MLVPVEKRDQKFYLGSMRFDPVVVGYSTDEQPGAFLLDTSLPGNLNQGHEFRNLTVEELEDRLGLTWNGVSTRDERWARVLAMEIENYRGLSEQARWEKIREASGKYLNSRSQKNRAKGVLGPEFSEEERWQLVEYLKSL
jgi:ribosomal protein L29